jgi:thioredoxin reductase/ferredoxin
MPTPPGDGKEPPVETESILIKPDGSFELAQPVELPPIIDILIAGAGPAGTTAAFRARERSLSALVIDPDDVLKRIRDYAKEKPILPDFGPVDNMRFPKAGPLIDLLHFGPCDKDAMHREWKRHYVRNNIPVRVGVELTGLERGDGCWAATLWNYRLKCEEAIPARHVVLALGRGVPRRFDIPGNTDGVAFRLNTAEEYVGFPVCVIGGGTSAAEAAIAVSNAKIQAEDPTEVFWSYRGTKMPRVSRALADDFFQAYVGNGNIRYLPRSEPAAIIVGDDKKEYLSVRTDRRSMENRPGETTHLEFPKEHCIACIGEDIPEDFLKTLGIHMRSSKPGARKRMVVSPLMETELPDVFMIGDTLSDIYLQTQDFRADPGTFDSVRRPGNIKAAIRDGVFVVEVIQQRMEGREPIAVELEYAESVIRAPGKKSITTLIQAPDPQAPPPESTHDEERQPAAGHLVRLLPSDVEEEQYAIGKKRVLTIGRRGADITFENDSLLSDAHASVSHGPDGFHLRNDGGETGVFLRLRPGEAMVIAPGSILRAGRQFLLFETVGGAARAVHYDRTGKEVGRYAIGEKTAVWGRQAPDRNLDPEDGSLSKRHLSVACRDGTLLVGDLKSTNGTYLKVDESVRIGDGDEFRAGQQRFRLRAHEENRNTVTKLESKVIVSAIRKPAPAPAAPKSPGAGAAPSPGECTVTFSGDDVTVSTDPGMFICEVAEDNGITIEAECRGGACGSDPVRIVSGMENLSAKTDLEKRTLEDLCGLEDPACRLACMAKVNGPVTVEVIAAGH